MMKTFAFVFSLVLCAHISAQPKTYSTKYTAVAPVIDGFGNDEVWSKIPTASGFVQREPEEGVSETERTEFKIAFDDQSLYIYAMMYDSQPDSIVSRLSRRDDIPESDWFGIGFDSYYDKQTAFVFIVLPSGSKADNLTYNDGRDEDYSWDPVWEAETKILPNGWSAELKIPLSQIRFSEGNDTWGMNVARRISRKLEETNWNLMSQKVDGVVSQFGTMTGMAEIKLPKVFEVLPYGVGASEHYPQTSSRVKVEKIRPDIGVDLKYGVSSNFTLDATINPDFAQVEADPAVLNLTQFETFYPEKRPFFIEGTQILRFVTFGGDFGPGLFYSRRIGKPVGVRMPGDGSIITEEPRTATILGAMKLSGKTEYGTSLGLMTSLTDKEVFSYRDTLGAAKTLQAEPQASYNLFRIKQDFWGNSNIGAIVTGTSREGRNPAFTVGTDWDVKFSDNNYRLNGFLAGSRITRPNGEMREGTAGKVNAAKVSGEWTYGTSYDFTSKKYFINDLGYFRAPNDYGFVFFGGYRNFTPGPMFRNYNFSGNAHIRWNYDRLTLFRELSANAYGQLLNFWSLSGGVSYSFSAQDPYEPRGFGVFNYPASLFIRGEIESDNRQSVVVNAEENYRTYENGGLANNAEVSIKYRPTTSIETELSVEYGIERDLDRFADAVVDTVITFAATSPAALYGKRDVDGFDVTLRGTILFTHNLSLQLYNQFFWAKGSFNTATYALLNPMRGLTPYSYAVNHDFNQTSLQTNVVLRWEYREGSTFYFVWSHGRAFFQNGGYHSDLGANIDNTFLRTSPDNVYVAKISYWMNI